MKRLGWNPATVLSRGPTLGWFWFRWSEKLIRPSCIRSIGSQLHRTVRITKSKDDITAYFTGHSQTKYWVYTFTAFLIYIHHLNIFSNANAFNIFHQSWIIWGQLEFVSIVVISPPLPPHYFYFYTFWFLQTLQKLSLIQENKISLLTTKHKKFLPLMWHLLFFLVADCTAADDSSGLYLLLILDHVISLLSMGYLGRICAFSVWGYFGVCLPLWPASVWPELTFSPLADRGKLCHQGLPWADPGRSHNQLHLNVCFF